MTALAVAFLILIALLLLVAAMSVRVVKQYEELHRISLRIVTMPIRS